MISAELQIAIRAAKTAGRLLLSAKPGSRSLTIKKEELLSSNTRKQFVTEMDRRCESAIKRILMKAFPDYGVLGEESGGQDLNRENIWVIDPLDGTISYAQGLDSYGVAVGLLHRGESVLGVVYLPYHQELFFAEKGYGAFCNEAPIHVSDTRDLKDSIVSLGHQIFRLNDYPRVIKELVQTIKRLRVSESCSREMCLVAAGKIDGFVRTNQPTYDYMMGKIIIEEAGGRVTDFQAAQLNIRLNTERNADILASNDHLHEALAAYLIR